MIVLDASVVASLVVPLTYSVQASQKMVNWSQAATELLAPILLQYEVAAVLRKIITVNILGAEEALKAMNNILALGIEYVPPSPVLHEVAFRWAGQLGHSKTYDAHYLAVAELKKAELWTADRRLVNSVRQQGVAWVRWIGDEL